MAKKKVEHNPREIDRICQLMKQMGQPTRLSILLLLQNSSQSFSNIRDYYLLNTSQAGISHHLMLMKHGGLVRSKRTGNEMIYELTEDARKLVKVIGV